MKKSIKIISVFLLIFAFVIGGMPMRTALANEAWTAYGRAGHASASGNNVSFYGHPSDPFVTLLFRAASDGDYRTLTFHLSEGNSDWHTLEGSGFLYNAGISNGVVNGDAVLFSANSVALYKLTNVSLSSLQGLHFSACPGVSLVESKSKPTYSSGTTWYLKLVMSPGSLKVEKHASPGFNGAAETIFSKTFAVSERSPYSGYGPFASFISHGCPSISTSAFQQFNLTIKPNTPPTIAAPDVTLKRSEAFSAMAGVSAMDEEDGNLTASAKLTGSNVETEMPGIYQAAYAVADILGASAAHTRTVTVLADAYYKVYDQDTGAPIEGVGIVTSAGAMEPTDETGITPVMWVTPGVYQWEIQQHHEDYLPLTASFDVQIDSAANEEWPMRIPVPLEHKYRDAAVSLALDAIAGEPDKDTVRYNQEAVFNLTITSNSNETVCIAAEITAPDTLELLCDPLITTEALSPGESVTYSVPCKVVSLLDTAIATLGADVVEITLADTGEVVADENPDNDSDTADLPIKNVPIVITKLDVRMETVMEGVVFQVRSGETPISFIKMENGAWIKADVAPAGSEEAGADNLPADNLPTENIPTDNEGKLTIYGIGEGAYTLHETETLPGYVLPPKPWALTVNVDAEPEGDYTLKNAPTVMILSKIDSTTEAPLDGAAFRILDEDSKPILLTLQENGEYYPDEQGEETFTTKDGKATLSYLPRGSLTVEETAPPKGYAVSKPIPFELKSEHVEDAPLTITIENRPLAVVLRKITKENTALTGAGFAITKGSGATIMAFTKGSDGIYRRDDFGKEVTLMVDQRGEILLYGLDEGEYTAVETVVPEGYVAAVPQNFTMTEAYTSDTPYELLIVNEPFVKLGFDDGWILPVAIVLLVLSAGFTVTLVLKKKTGAWWFLRFIPKGRAKDESQD